MGDRLIAGVDEAGRGPLAGPVVAAAVVLSQSQKIALEAIGLNDSKKLTAKKREKIFHVMLNIGVLWKAQAASAKRIDTLNILQASLWAMNRAVRKLPLVFEEVIVDGTFCIPGLETIVQEAIPKADATVPEVAAASIVAKVLRDRAMIALDKIYPAYGFKKHKGYPTSAHRLVLAQIGPSPIHRRSFTWKDPS
ncbi:MAG TPA: ribonuclease HII [Aminobacterium sp.]|jgi:ribonuclease HII|uniref:ribonuclease HII n=1 Tax=Aminobacterium TaxID=81466 RepID=UPI0004640E94|nr:MULTISPECIES: ribonuclease HII [Aminobacterium]HCA41267.1 ribonuclease HII [Aminobacterium sp.]